MPFQSSDVSDWNERRVLLLNQLRGIPWAGQSRQLFFAFLILPRSGQADGFWEVLSGTGVSSGFIPSCLFFP